MANWWTDLDALHHEIWKQLERGVAEPTSPARHPVLATEGTTGGGEARLVVLRAASREDALLEVHTDTASAKVGELAREPRATLLIWDSTSRIQLRLRARAEIRKGQGAAVVWSRIPARSRAVYGGTPMPGKAIAAPEDFVGHADPARFAVVTAHIHEIDALHLGEDMHRRAIFRAEDNWHGQWVAP